MKTLSVLNDSSKTKDTHFPHEIKQLSSLKSREKWSARWMASLKMASYGIIWINVLGFEAMYLGNRKWAYATPMPVMFRKNQG